MHTFAIGDREGDLRFKEVISGHASRGMVVVGLLGILSVVVNLGTNVIYGKTIVFLPDDPSDTILIWDKLVLLGLSITLIGLSGRDIALSVKRFVASAMAVIASMAILVEDYLQGTVFVSEQYIGLLIFVVVVAIPFKPWHSLVLVPFVVACYIVTSAILQDHPSIVIDGFTPGVIVFMTIIVLLGIGLSFLLYNSRFEQHRQRIKSEKLSQSLKQALTQLTLAQDKLVHAQRMASLGNLSAGIAHELSNPLNFVNNFAELSSQLCDDLDDVLARAGDTFEKGDREDIEDIVFGLRENLKRIDKHGNRATDIVKDMIHHTDIGSAELQEVDLSKLVDSNIAPALNRIRLRDSDFEPAIVRNYDSTLKPVNVIRTEVGRVYWNLLINSFYAMQQRLIDEDDGYEPRLTITTGQRAGYVVVQIADNGGGIDEEVVDSVFEPFVTTKPPGLGTGLGLSMAYEIIVQGHNGEVSFDNRPGDGVTFNVSLPMTGSA